ncbi:MAG: polymer-forming cytoskeletal protein [Candidatus Peribacteraceae bacterium]|nr:polymer-forming cytoskeletal protein [Candidatus Peribacteraceae bacterium]
MKRLLAASLLGTLLLAAAPALAATFRGGDTVTLSAPVSGDLYVSGGTIDIRQDVRGDLYILGGTIDVQNDVAQGLNVAGGKVKILSRVGDDVRVAGGDVEIRGVINGDLLVAGGTVTVGSDAVVMGEAYVSGGQVVVRGTVNRNIKANGGSVILEGIAHGNVDLQGESVTVSGPVEGDTTIVARNLTVAEGASFRGSVDYWTPSPTEFGDALAAGQGATYRPDLAKQFGRAETRGFAVALLGAFAVYSLLSAALVLALLVFFTKTIFTDAAKYVRRRPGMSFLLGLAYVAVVPLAIVLLLVTVIGIPLALLLLAAYAFTFVFIVPVASLVAAKWIELTYEKEWSRLALFGVSIGVFILLRLIGIIPVVGWIAKGIVVLLALGALLVVKMNRLKKII